MKPSDEPKVTLAQAQRRLRALANPERAQFLLRFFRTGPGQYAEGVVFLGLTMPDVRTLARDFAGLPLEDVVELLHSKWHEERTLALLLLVKRSAKADAGTRAHIARLYLDNTAFINNWDLVDLSAEHVIGGWLRDRDRAVLYQLARSASLWERRIAVLATFHFIKQGDFTDTLRLCELLLDDSHDLIHKATGWMLREVGKRDVTALRNFLDEHAPRMPRTMLRYAIEKLPELERKRFMAVKRDAEPQKTQKTQ
jgi:3-methyladenine DNA glycosylase AlkD